MLEQVLFNTDYNLRKANKDQIVVGRSTLHTLHCGVEKYASSIGAVRMVSKRVSLDMSFMGTALR